MRSDSTAALCLWRARAPDYRAAGSRLQGGVDFFVFIHSVLCRRQVREFAQVVRQSDDAGAGLVAGSAELHLRAPAAVHQITVSTGSACQRS